MRIIITFQFNKYLIEKVKGEHPEYIKIFYHENFRFL